MEKFEVQITELKIEVEKALNVLLFLPSKVDIDRLASALALMLLLKDSGKQAWVVTEDSLKVSHSDLYGVGEVLNQLPKPSSGNLTVTLEGVVDSEGKVPALEKLDWYPEGNNLNLIFHVISGQRFEPTNIIPRYSGGGIDLIFMVGVSNISEVGPVYQQNVAQLAGIPIINIDNDSSNNNFGKINILDPNASSVSEMMVELFPRLGLNLTPDPASNLISGIYSATSNLTQNAQASTFLILAQALQAGGKLPANLPAGRQDKQQFYQTNQRNGKNQYFKQTQQPQQVQQPNNHPPAGGPMPIQNKPQQDSGFDLSKIFPTEEKPVGEFTSTTASFEGANPAPDWLTPKIYKGGGG